MAHRPEPRRNAAQSIFAARQGRHRRVGYLFAVCREEQISLYPAERSSGRTRGAGQGRVRRRVHAALRGTGGAPYKKVLTERREAAPSPPQPEPESTPPTVEGAVQTAAQTPTLAPPVPADTAVDMPKASAPVEPSPAQMPLVPPPGTQPNGTVAAPELLSTPTPATEASPLPPEPLPPEPLPPEPFADELPPDFWGDALEPLTSPAPSSTAPSSTAPTDESDASPPAAAPPASSSSASKPLDGSLQDDPRFVLLTELFPGRISDWQSAEPVDAAPDTGADAADDAAGDPATVDLDAGLDADETASDAD